MEEWGVEWAVGQKGVRRGWEGETLENNKASFRKHSKNKKTEGGKTGVKGGD